MALPANISQWLDLAVTYAPLAGFTAIGIATTTWQAIKLTLKKTHEIGDKRAYGDEYHSIRLQAERDGCFKAEHIKSLRKSIQARTEGLTGAIKSTLNTSTLEELKRVAPGSSRLRFQEILSGPPLLMPCASYDLINDERQSVSDRLIVLEEFFAKPTSIKGKSLPNPKYLILGNAGDGKSLFSLRVRTAIASNNKRFCLQISASDFNTKVGSSTGETDVGSKNWCGALLSLRMGSTSPTSLEIRLLGDLLEKEGIILIDSLDEIAQSLSRVQITTFLQSWAIARAAVVLARSSYFDSALKGEPEMSGFKKVLIEPPSNDARRAFVKAFCRRYTNAPNDERANEILRSFDSFPAVAELVKKPLLLLMACELGVEGHIIGKSADVASIYEKFISQFIDRDIRRAHNEVAARTILELLQDIAWKEFKERQESKNDSVGVDVSVLKKIIRDRLSGIDLQAIERIETLLANCSLTSIRPFKHGGEDRLLQFNHETFIEFLTASRLNDWLLGRRDDGGDFFDFIESPGLSYFIKEYFSRLKLDSHARQLARRRLFSLYEELSSKRQSLQDESAARMASFAAGQVAYYLGMIADSSDRDVLKSAALTDPDFWVKRAAAIGLAFGGDETAYHALIDEMRAGLASGDFSLCRKHIAIELGFYGDQEFDRRDPTFDRGESSCRRLVSRVAGQAAFAVEQPNWRLDLFDLLYLARHRPASEGEFYVVLREVASELDACMQAIDKVKEGQKYPEITEVKALLATMRSSKTLSDVPFAVASK